jgi:formylmethanofuran dehydrogenase subunit B
VLGGEAAFWRISRCAAYERCGLSRLRASTLERVAEAAAATAAGKPPRTGEKDGDAARPGGALGALFDRFDSARYAVIVYDAEPHDGDGDVGEARDRSWRAEALITLSQQLNASIRCSLMALRAGGNRNGAEAVMTWQTGFPMTVDYSRGVPRYRPDEATATLLERGSLDAIVVVGNARAAGIPSMDGVPRVVIGPLASEVKPAAEVAIDTGVAGIHEGGMAFRMDDIPLPLRPSLPGPAAAPDTAFVVEALDARIRARSVGAGSKSKGGRK